MFKYKPAQLKKAIVGGVALLVTALVAGLGNHLFPAAWEPWINLVITVAGTYGIYKVPFVSGTKNSYTTVRPDVTTTIES